MGLLNNLMSKVGNAVEKAVSKNLSGDSKKEYEEYKQKQADQKLATEQKQQEIKNELELHKTTASKNELKELLPLLQKINVLDSNLIWVGGFDNFKTNQNAKAANLFSGNKNIKVFAVNGDTYYLCKFENDSFYAYKMLTKQDITGCEVEGLVSKKLKIKTKDNHPFSIDVTENKEALSKIKELFSK